jgi:hypothetical protein
MYGVYGVLCSRISRLVLDSEKKRFYPFASDAQLLTLNCSIHNACHFFTYEWLSSSVSCVGLFSYYRTLWKNCMCYERLRMTWASYQAICLQLMMAVIELVSDRDTIAMCCFHCQNFGYCYYTLKICFTDCSCGYLPGVHATMLFFCHYWGDCSLSSSYFCLLEVLYAEKILYRPWLHVGNSTFHSYELLSSKLSRWCLHQIHALLTSWHVFLFKTEHCHAWKLPCSENILRILTAIGKRTLGMVLCPTIVLDSEKRFCIILEVIPLMYLHSKAAFQYRYLLWVILVFHALEIELFS